MPHEIDPGSEDRTYTESHPGLDPRVFLSRIREILWNGEPGIDRPDNLVFSAPRVFISQILLAAIITGILYGLVDLVTDRIQFQRWSFWRLMVLRLAMHFTIIVITFAVLVMSRVRFDILTADHLQQQSLADVLTNKSFQVFAFYFLIVTVLLNAYQQVNQKFGRGVLLEMMLGKFHKPKEKMRIFMFIDLKSSVRIAEELGHVRYSQLLQDCYFDLNTQLSRYSARVYQYVGDQAVLHWRPENGLLDNNCVRFFFAFVDRLKLREDHYMKEYGVMPFFKAAAHIGRVTIAEVGVLKRSIAFHGDTVNTTSRGCTTNATTTTSSCSSRKSC